jgi:hypothetical protein
MENSQSNGERPKTGIKVIIIGAGKTYRTSKLTQLITILRLWWPHSSHRMCAPRPHARHIRILPISQDPRRYHNVWPQRRSYFPPVGQWLRCCRNAQDLDRFTHLWFQHSQIRYWRDRHQPKEPAARRDCTDVQWTQRRVACNCVRVREDYWR